MGIPRFSPIDDDTCEPDEFESMSEDEIRAADVEAGGQQCRRCGCTDNSPCAEGCCWVEDDLCSACEEAE